MPGSGYGLGMSNATDNDARIIAIADARRAARADGHVRYVCQWPAGHYTVETRKPMMRTGPVVCVPAVGEVECA